MKKILILIICLINAVYAAEDVDDSNNPIVVACLDGDLQEVINLVNGSKDIANQIFNLKKIFLCPKKLKFSESGYSLLHLASLSGNLDIVKYLIKCGADVHTQTKGACKYTPLFIAFRFEKNNIFEWIIDNRELLRIDIDKEYSGNSLLGWACFHDKINALELLINKGANVNHRSRDGKSPVFFTTNIEILKLLVKNGADINAQSKEGTPLRKAIHQNHPDIVKFLLDNNANIYSLDKDSHNAFEILANHYDWYQEFKHFDIMKLLLIKDPKLIIPHIAHFLGVIIISTNPNTNNALNMISRFFDLLERYVDINMLKKARFINDYRNVDENFINTIFKRIYISLLRLNIAHLNMNISLASLRVPLFEEDNYFKTKDNLIQAIKSNNIHSIKNLENYDLRSYFTKKQIFDLLKDLLLSNYDEKNYIELLQIINKHYDFCELVDNQDKNLLFYVFESNKLETAKFLVHLKPNLLQYNYDESVTAFSTYSRLIKIFCDQKASNL